MQTHDLDPSLIPGARRAIVPRRGESGSDTGAGIALRGPEALGVGSVLHLQRAAGNSTVSRLLDEQPASPVTDVVGRGGGRPLEPELRGVMEERLGHDFGSVRVHTDHVASESARAIHAQAYTVGSDVVFQTGRYQPDTPAGQHMLAHELTHVMQQSAGPVDGTPAPGGIRISDPSDRFEQAAERSADGVMAAQPVAAPAPAPAAQREEETVQEVPVQSLAVQREEEEEEAAG